MLDEKRAYEDYTTGLLSIGEKKKRISTNGEGVKAALRYIARHFYYSESYPKDTNKIDCVRNALEAYIGYSYECERCDCNKSCDAKKEIKEITNILPHFYLSVDKKIPDDDKAKYIERLENKEILSKEDALSLSTKGIFYKLYNSDQNSYLSLNPSSNASSTNDFFKELSCNNDNSIYIDVVIADAIALGELKTYYLVRNEKAYADLKTKWEKTGKKWNNTNDKKIHKLMAAYHLFKIGDNEYPYMVKDDIGLWMGISDFRINDKNDKIKLLPELFDTKSSNNNIFKLELLNKDLLEAFPRIITEDEIVESSNFTILEDNGTEEIKQRES